MLAVVSLLWQDKGKVKPFSRMYDGTWAVKLFAGFARNLTVPFEKVLLTDRPRDLPADIRQVVQPDLGLGGYGDCIRAYGLGRPMILAGLDTVVTGNCDDLAKYCLTAKVQALPRDPYRPHIACNGVALVPAGWSAIASKHRGENDMEWVRRFPHVFIDDLLPGQLQSFKGSVKRKGLGDTRIVYFHGLEKPHELPHVGWIREHWR